MSYGTEKAKPHCVDFDKLDWTQAIAPFGNQPSKTPI